MTAAPHSALETPDTPAERRLASSANLILAGGVAAAAVTLLGPIAMVQARGLRPFGDYVASLFSFPAALFLAISITAGVGALAWGVMLRRRGDARRLTATAWVSVGILLVLSVPFGLALLRGMVPYLEAVEAFQSAATLGIILVGLGLAAVVVPWGFVAHRRMPTKASRERAIAGAVLATQALVVGGFLLAFRTFGDPERFVFHFLNVEVVQGAVGEFVRAAVNTILLAFVGELGGVILGLLLAVLLLSKRPVVRAPARVYTNFFRGTPLIWQLSVFYFGFALGLGIRLDLDIGPVSLSAAYVTAMIVFILNTAAYAAEVFRAGIQSIERGQMEAARSLGMSYGQAMRYSIIPQAVRRVIPPLMNEFVILIKDTSLVVVLGLLATEYELFTRAREGYTESFNATFFTAAAVGYLAVTLPLIGAVNAVERRLRSGLVGVGA